MKMKINMILPKTPIFCLTALAASVIVASAAENKPAIPARTARPAPAVVPSIGISVPGSIDPTTGLPFPEEQASSWKDAQWKDPDKTLSVSFDDVPVEEVARNLRKQFNEDFDIVIPRLWQPPGSTASFDASRVPVRIQLKNVTASEAFNAMNMMFESEGNPIRWELRMNGNRPTVLLRVMPMALPNPLPPGRKIFFVGEMVEGDKPGNMTMEELVKTISEIYTMSFGAQGNISDHLQFHKQAQLLIVSGSSDEISFVAETLSALRARSELGRRSAAAKAEAKEKQEAKPVGEKQKGP